jgi:hypothetical protein
VKSAGPFPTQKGAKDAARPTATKGNEPRIALISRMGKEKKPIGEQKKSIREIREICGKIFAKVSDFGVLHHKKRPLFCAF